MITCAYILRFRYGLLSCDATINYNGLLSINDLLFDLQLPESAICSYPHKRAVQKSEAYVLKFPNLFIVFGGNDLSHFEQLRRMAEHLYQAKQEVYWRNSTNLDDAKQKLHSFIREFNNEHKTEEMITITLEPMHAARPPEKDAHLKIWIVVVTAWIVLLLFAFCVMLKS